MPTAAEITQTIYSVITETNRDLPPTEQLALKPETVLFGTGSTLDSLGLVSLVIATEQRVGEQFGRPVSLTDERAMSQRNSPFRTVQTLAAYIESLLNEPARG